MVEIFSFPVLTVLTSYLGNLSSKCMHCFTGLVLEPRARAVTGRKIRQKTQVYHVHNLYMSIKMAIRILSINTMAIMVPSDLEDKLK